MGSFFFLEHYCQMGKNVIQCSYHTNKLKESVFGGGTLYANDGRYC